MASNGNYDIRYARIPITISVDPRLSSGMLKERWDSDFRSWDAFAEPEEPWERTLANHAEKFAGEFMPELQRRYRSTPQRFSEIAREVWNSDTLAEQFYGGNPWLDKIVIDPLLDAQRYVNQRTGRMLDFKNDLDADLRVFAASAAASQARRNKPRRAKLGISKRISHRRRQAKRWWEDNVSWRYAKERPYDEDW